MLALAYRNISRALTASAETASAVGCDDPARLDRRVQRRAQRCAANSLLRDLLARDAGYPAGGWQLLADGHDKPKLLTTDGPSSIDVSLSHSRAIVAAAITDLGEIGIDVEYRAPARSIYEIAEYAFGPRERQVIQSGWLRDFYRIWTLREALAKARGIGFPMLADGRDYFADAPTSGVWQAIIDGEQWFFHADELPDNFAIAVAIAPRASMQSDLLGNLVVQKFA
jgi:4'-phosphopantetheinyl transferase